MSRQRECQSSRVEQRHSHVTELERGFFLFFSPRPLAISVLASSLEGGP
jgi:hypothetical protein